jgi:hypothetical protein
MESSLGNPCHHRSISVLLRHKYNACMYLQRVMPHLPFRSSQFVSGLRGDAHWFRRAVRSHHDVLLVQDVLSHEVSEREVRCVCMWAPSSCWSSYSCPRRSLRADQILKRLIDFIVRRGILVTTAQISTLIVFFVQPNGMYWTPVYFCTSKIYVITMSESCLRRS